MSMPLQAIEAGAETQGPGPLGSLILGVVEGLTEFLPISSTGHLIVANRVLGSSDPLFEVMVQVGAISAIAWLYRQRLWTAASQLFVPAPNPQGANLWVAIVATSLPAIVLGLALDDWIESVLFSPATVAVSMVVGGVLLLWLERWLGVRPDPSETAASWSAPSLRVAFAIGLFQCLALIPGTSRSGATIAGALLLGMRRGSAAEYSFLAGLPILYGAAAYKAVKELDRFDGAFLLDLCIGIVASFLTALAIVGPFVGYVRRHSFAPFAVYRILAGIALGAVVVSGLLAG